MNEENEDQDIKTLAKEWRDIETEFKAINLRLGYLQEQIEERKRVFAARMSRGLEITKFRGLKEDDFYSFLDNPYAIIPRGPHKKNE